MPTRVSETPRTVARIYSGPAPHWVGDGFRVRGYFQGTRDLALDLSPFLLLDYHEPFSYEPNSGFRRGVGPHPHRGFETVTIAFSGSVAHHDSVGNSGIVGPGDVQWMTAGSGILHQEYHAEEFSRAGGVMHMAQIWVNLPAAQKMTAPAYQHLSADHIANVTLDDNGGSVRVIAGTYNGVHGPAKTTTPVEMYEVRLRKGARLPVHTPASYTMSMLVMDGELLTHGDTRAQRGEYITFGHDGDEIIVTALADAHVLVLGGEPIAEPIARYGPFVMNTEKEIVDAVRDFNNGRFGRM